METLADDLRHEREQRQISLETIASITKVSSRHLQALEAGDFAELPGGIFRKGILRGYLAALELDEHPWIDRFELCLRQLEPESVPVASASASPLDPRLTSFAENVRRTRPDGNPPSSSSALLLDRRWYGVALLLLALLAFGWCVWNYALRGHLVL